MKINNDSQNPTYPTKLWYQPPCIFDFPFSVEVSDDWLTVGSGIGGASAALTTAIGEYFERRHFYLEVSSNTTMTLERAVGTVEARKFIKAFGQTRTKRNTTQALSNHVFNMSDAIRISDCSACKIPTICISLSYYGNDRDNDIYPSRDTCGCSFHSNYESALLGAVKETLERQFLLRFWLTKKYRRILNPLEVIAETKNSTSLRLYNILLARGELSLIDISDDSFPGACIISIYGNSNPNKNVRYCTGMSYAETKAQAIEKSLYELWQTFRYMHLFAELNIGIDHIHDSYLRHFMQCNNYQTFTEITSSGSVWKAQSAQINLHPFDLSGLLQTLADQNIEGYLYTAPIQVENRSYIGCKFISPSLFMHMDNSKNINISNSYSSRFSDIIDPSRKEKMVPFP
jgi:hypothetical protein